MALDLLSGITASIAATIVWFIIGAVVYMNPFVAKIYKKYEADPSVKNRTDVKTFIINTFVFGILILIPRFVFIMTEKIRSFIITANPTAFSAIALILISAASFFLIFYYSY